MIFYFLDIKDSDDGITTKHQLISRLPKVFLSNIYSCLTRHHIAEKLLIMYLTTITHLLLFECLK
jgi:hypothetical protein